MNGLDQVDARRLTHDVWSLSTHLPVPGAGVLPVNAFVLGGEEPVLVDTGLAASRSSFLDALAGVLDPADLRWVWITHTDADHVGNLTAVLERAPRARVVTNFLGMGKMGLLGLPTDRVHLLNPGQVLEAGRRRLRAVVPPSYDAPETTAAFDEGSRALFSADCFGTLLAAPVQSAQDLGHGPLRDAIVAWATVDAPWLGEIEEAALRRRLDEFRSLGVEDVFGSHTPPAHGVREELLDALFAARGSQPFVGPDQAAFVALLGAGAGAA